MQESVKKSTSERLAEILPQLSKDQLRYIVAFQDYPSKKEACESIGLKTNTVYKWPDVVDEAARLMAIESASSAVVIRQRNLVKAMMVKVAGLDSEDESIRQKSATELIEWELGKAGNKLDVTSGGKEIKGYAIVSPDDWNKDDGD